MLEVATLSTPAELESVRDFWTHKVVYPTADFELFSHICESRKHSVRPYVLAVKDDNQLVALLIGRLETNRRPLRLGYLKVNGPKLRTLTFIYGGNPGEWNEATTDTVLQEITRALDWKEIDLAHFAYLREDSFLLSGLGRLLVSKRYSHRFAAPQRHWELELTDPDHDFLDRLSRSSRHTIRKERRRFERKFGDAASFRYFQYLPDVEKCAKDIETIAAQSYHRNMGAGFFNSDEMLMRMKIEAHRKRLLVYILYISDVPVAYWMGVVSNQVVYGDYTGYRSEFSNLEPGKMTLLSLIELLTSMKSVQSIDFGFGDAFYKRQLGTKSWEEISVVVYGKSFLGRSVYFFEQALSKIEDLARNLVSRLRMEQSLKKRWRKYLSKSSESPKPK